MDAGIAFAAAEGSAEEVPAEPGHEGRGSVGHGLARADPGGAVKR